MDEMDEKKRRKLNEEGLKEGEGGFWSCRRYVFYFSDFEQITLFLEK